MNIPWLLRKGGCVLATVLTIGLVWSMTGAAQHAGQKVLLIDSYHEGYEWSDGIVAGVRSVLKGTGVELKIFRMDTKRNDSEEFKKAASLRAKDAIESDKPDIVIACDDNTSQYIIQPFYKDAALPVVFCGLNWDASGYGYPYKNATGIVEVALIPQLVDNLKTYAKGSRIGFLTSDTETERKEGTWIKKIFKMQFASEEYVKTLAAWKDTFTRMQTETDMLILNSVAGINDWDEAEAATWALAHGRIPSGTTYTWLMPVAMIGLIKVAEEQGEWAAQTALKILAGTSPASIPIVQNKRASVSVNVKLASKAGIVFPSALLKNATVIK
jgi:ABC-type uncharacterized transport system substrate-binding protein